MSNSALATRKLTMIFADNYVSHWAKKNDVTVLSSGILQTGSERLKHLDAGTIATQMVLDYQKDWEEYYLSALAAGLRGPAIGTRLHEAMLRNAYEAELAKMKAEGRRQLAEMFRYDPVTNGNNELDKFLESIIGKDKVTPVDLAVMKHWIWLIKRKMFGLPVVYHIMPVFYGKKQGTGKSTAVRNLVSPIKDFVINKSVSELNDSRETPALTNNYVVVFDELAGSAKADIETLKRLITEDQIDYRKMKSHDQIKAAQSCSFVGTSNKPIDQMIRDSTGVRRFFQLRCADEMDWKLLNSIDYNKLFKGINETIGRGYIEPVLAELATMQREWVNEDPLEVWLQEAGITLAESGDEVAEGFEWEPSRKLYDEYSEWLKTSGYGAVNIQTFSKKFAELAEVSKRLASGKVYSIKRTNVKAPHLRVKNLPKIKVKD